MKTYLLTPVLAVLCLGLTACEREDPHYPEQPYPQPGAYPQPYPQPGAYPQPAPYPAPYPAPAAQGPTPTAIPGIMKNADGTCFATPPSLDPNTPAAPIPMPCPPM